jgi:hypothetical protein
MSEQPTSTATRPPKAPGKTYAGLTRNQWFIVGGVFAAALAYIVWRRRQAAASTSATAPTNQGSNECTDANGNPVDCNELFAQELAALQNSLDQLGAQSGGGGSSGSGGSFGGGGGGNGTTPSVPDTVTGAPATTQPPATPTSSGGTTGTRIERRAGAVTGLTATAVTRTSFKATWRAAANATGGYAYIVRDLASHTEVKSGTTRSTSVTVSGLKPGTDYNFGVQGLPGGPGDNIHVRTK